MKLFETTRRSLAAAALGLVLAPTLATAQAQPAPMEAKITLEADRVIELAFFNIEGGKEPDLMANYLPNILPIAAKYGGSLLGVFNVTAVVEGEMRPQAIAIFAWDDLETREVFVKQPEAIKLFPIRDEALTFFKLGYYSVDQDTELTLRSDRVYEFFNAWTTDTAAASLPAYFENTAEVKTRYGSPQFIAELQPHSYLRDIELDHMVHPDMAGIVEWVNTGAYYAMNTDPAFVEHKPLLDDALEDIQVLHTQFAFPPATQ